MKTGVRKVVQRRHILHQHCAAVPLRGACGGVGGLGCGICVLVAAWSSFLDLVLFCLCIKQAFELLQTSVLLAPSHEVSIC